MFRVIASVVVPVIIAMGLCVWLVLLLRNEAYDDLQQSGGITSAVYTEKKNDSVENKLRGGALNAIAFVGFITAMTFGLFLLFKYRMGGLIWGYMGLSGLLIFGVLGGSIFMQVLQKLGLAVDMITVSFVIWNFSVGGVLMTFFWPGPLVVKQGYLIMVSTIVSFYFTHIPEWTTWSMLIAMALYDLYAVLSPNGPLKLIVELAQERDEDIPALVYESRGSESEAQKRYRAERQAAAALASRASEQGGASASYEGGNAYDPSMDSDSDEYGLPNSIKLGLGDFIFYSVLVGRAAMYSPITCAFCFVAVIIGLVLTLFALAAYGKALPALPISIALGVVTYFISRFWIEPAIVRGYARAFICDA